MARTWFAGPPTAHMVPPSNDPKGTVSKKDDPAQSNKGVLSKNRTAVQDSAPAQQITPTKAIQSDSESDRSATWVTPFSSPQKELITQPTKEAVDASANLAKLVQQQQQQQQHSKLKDPRRAATSEGPSTSKPVEMMDTFAPSSSAPRRAPTAQMVPLPPNAAVTTAPAAATTQDTPTKSLYGPCTSPMSVSSPHVSFLATAPPLLSLPSIMPPSPTASLKTSIPKKSTPRTPKITLTPAPATAPSAFKDAALAAHVQNTKFLSPVKQRTKGIKKRQHIKTTSPPKSVLTPKSVPEEKHGRGRPRTRFEERPLQQNKQHRPPVQPTTPCSRTGFPNQSNLSSFAPPAFPLQQQQAVTLNISGELKPEFCSEEPRLWPGCGDYTTSLLRFDSKLETTHSEPIQACTNHAAHRDPHKPHSHGVCKTCRSNAIRHIKATRLELLGAAWWPLCKACGDNEMQHTNPSKKGCSCGRAWLCFPCLTLELEMRNMKDSVEAEFRRRTFIGEGMDGDVKTVVMGWACQCGREIGPNATLMKCVGCQGMLFGRPDPQKESAREKASMKTALAWT